MWRVTRAAGTPRPDNHGTVARRGEHRASAPCSRGGWGAREHEQLARAGPERLGLRGARARVLGRVDGLPAPETHPRRAPDLCVPHLSRRVWAAHSKLHRQSRRWGQVPLGPDHPENGTVVLFVPDKVVTPGGGLRWPFAWWPWGRRKHTRVKIGRLSISRRPDGHRANGEHRDKPRRSRCHAMPSVMLAW